MTFVVHAQKSNISTHAPRTGSDPEEATSGVQPPEFQPTLPARGATTAQHPDSPRGGHFNPRSPHGERRAATHSDRRSQSDFNPRSPHGERQRFLNQAGQPRRFQPTLPARGATSFCFRNAHGGNDFNPRSPHGERQGCFQSFSWAFQHFNPRSPHGERPVVVGINPLRGVFQPTLPARGATCR